MQSLKRQNGMTAIGWLIVLALIGFFVLLTLRMLPSYLEYYKIVSSLDSMEKETGLEFSPVAIATCWNADSISVMSTPYYPRM